MLRSLLHCFDLMKRSRLSFLFACQALLGLAVWNFPAVSTVRAEPEVVDGIAALVNGEPITFSEVRELDAPRERSLRGNYSGQELADKLREARKGALQDLIDRQLILQEFKKKEFSIPPSLVEDRVNTIIREEFGGDRQAFVRTLQAQGYTMTKFKDAEKDKIIVQAMRFQNVKGDFLVSPDRLNQDYQIHRVDYTTPEQVHLWMISISKGTVANAHEKDPQRAVAEEIRDKLSKGGKFEQMASLYSDDTSHADGDWGWIDRKTLRDEITDAAFKLDANKIGPVLSLDNKYYVLKVSERKSEYVKPFSDVRPELEKRLTSETKAKMQDQWLAGLRSKAFIKIF